MSAVNPSGLCMCGCGQPAAIAKMSDARRGAVKGQPSRYASGHQLRKSPVDYIEDPDTGCWIWQLSKNGWGYGMTGRGGRRQPAHRYYYKQHKGSIPEGMQLDHLCRNRACVNPDHLEVVTPAGNSQRAIHNRLTPDLVRYIRASLASLKELERELGFPHATISDARHGLTWKSIEPVSAFQRGEDGPEVAT